MQMTGEVTSDKWRSIRYRRVPSNISENRPCPGFETPTLSHPIRHHYTEYKTLLSIPPIFAGRFFYLPLYR